MNTIVEADGMLAPEPRMLGCALMVTEVAPAAAAAVTNEPVSIIWPLAARYATSVPTGIAAGKPVPVKVMVVELELPEADTEKAESDTRPTQRTGKIVETGVAVGANTAFAELPVLRLEATEPLSIIDRLVPTMAIAAEATTVVAEQTAALKTGSGSSQTIASASPANVLAGQNCWNCFCLVMGFVKEQPKKMPVTWLTAVPVETAARVMKPRDNTTKSPAKMFVP